MFPAGRLCEGAHRRHGRGCADLRRRHVEHSEKPQHDRGHCGDFWKRCGRWRIGRAGAGQSVCEGGIASVVLGCRVRRGCAHRHAGACLPCTCRRGRVSGLAASSLPPAQAQCQSTAWLVHMVQWQVTLAACRPHGSLGPKPRPSAHPPTGLHRMPVQVQPLMCTLAVPLRASSVNPGRARRRS